MKSTSGMTLKDLVRERKEDAHSGDDSMRIHMGPIKEALQEDHIDLDETPVSRSRLVQALMRKFGEGFKLVPAAKKALEHYDRESDILKVIKYNRSKYHAR